MAHVRRAHCGPRQEHVMAHIRSTLRTSAATLWPMSGHGVRARERGRTRSLTAAQSEMSERERRFLSLIHISEPTRPRLI
eukprot:3537802-Rhodomonas_salina.1